MPDYYIYILECQNGTFYTGYTLDLRRRYQEHLKGSGKCKYTRSFPPVRIAAFWSIVTDLSSILKMEHKIKSLSRQQKIQLIENPNFIQRFLKDCKCS